MTKSFGVSYLWPAIPLNLKAMRGVLFRLPIPSKLLRPAALRPKDNDRLEINHNKKDQDSKNEEDD
jgi:stage V sporulation protein AF